MNRFTNPVVSLISGAEDNYKNLYLFFSVSTVCHIAAIVIFIFSSRHVSHGRFSPEIISVDLVSLSSPIPIKKRTVAPAIKKKKDLIKKNVSVEKNKTKKHLIQKNINDKPNQPVDVSRDASVTEAINRLKHQVETKNRNKQSAGSRKHLEQIDIYKAEIFTLISKNWNMPPYLADSSSGLMSVLVIKISPKGRIRDLWFEKKSGNREFDNICKKAVIKASPLPPLPKGFNRPYFEIGLRFTPLGLN